MDKDFAKEMLQLWFAAQTPNHRGRHNMMTVQVHRTKGGTTHNLWLLPINDLNEGGTRVLNVTAQVAAAMGLGFDKNSGGIPASASWVITHQYQQLGQMFGVEIEHESA